MSNPEGAPRAAIIGTGRSGTGYAARLITETTHTPHASCGHEGWWRALGERVPGMFCDASWLALPDIEAGTWSGPVVHVVRNPVDTVASLLRTSFFGAIVETPYPAFALQHCEAARDALPVGTITAAVEFWADWNARCAAVANLTVRIEDLSDWEGGADSVAAATLDLVAGVLDVEFGAWQLAAALPTDVNHDGDHLVIKDVNHENDEGYIWAALSGRGGAFGYAP